MNTCAEDHAKGGSTACDAGKRCDVIRKRLRPYLGIRPTSDGFDCALPIAMDSHSHCSFACDYCFADFTVQHREQTRKEVGQTSLKKVEKLFAGGGGKQFDLFRKALKYDRRNENGYPAPIQLGAICEPMDNIERNQGWLLKFIDLAIKYRQPIRISTKGNLALVDEYLEAFAKKPELFMVHFSIISPDDDLLPKIDRYAPTPTERLQAMNKLSEIGVEVALRFRPIIPGLSDATDDHPKAWKELLHKAHDAGARRISYEVMFLSGRPTKDIKARYRNMEKVIGIPLRKIYSTFGPKQACTRPSYKWTEGIMHAIHDEAQELGWDIGISDPVWKQLTECGCCCGISKDHPVFGNWERETATYALLRARRGEVEELTLDQIVPPWAYDHGLAGIVNPGAGPKAIHEHRTTVWADKLKEVWNDISAERGPIKYLQGAVKPKRVDDEGNMVYEYVGLNRTGKSKWPYWKIEQ